MCQYANSPVRGNRTGHLVPSGVTIAGGMARMSWLDWLGQRYSNALSQTAAVNFARLVSEEVELFVMMDPCFFPSSYGSSTLASKSKLFCCQHGAGNKINSPMLSSLKQS